MKALPTQFDDQSLSGAVATPTCSSCCCCCSCCCVATAIASSSLLAQRIAKEGKNNNVNNRKLLTVLASSFIPIAVVLASSVVWIYDLFTRVCTESRLPNSPNTYLYCAGKDSFLTGPLLIVAIFAVLLFLYNRVRIEKPVKRAALVTLLIVMSFTVEFFVGALLIMTGIGGVIYLIMIPAIVGWISVWYYRHIGKEANKASNDIVAQIQPAYTEVQLADSHNENLTKPDETTPQPQEPPQPNPPASSTQ